MVSNKKKLKNKKCFKSAITFAYNKRIDNGKTINRVVKSLRSDEDKRKKSKIDTDDGWNRTFYGSPTIGGLVVIGVIILYLIFQ